MHMWMQFSGKYTALESEDLGQRLVNYGQISFVEYRKL